MLHVTGFGGFNFLGNCSSFNGFVVVHTLMPAGMQIHWL